METVEVVIKIPKDEYDYMIANPTRYNVCDDETLLYNHIKNGTVLTKGHGKLIAEPTEEDIAKTVGGQNDFADCIREAVKTVFDNAPTILEASKEETTWGQEEKETFQCENCIWYDGYNHSCTTPHNMPNVILNKCPHLTTLLDAKDILSKVIKVVK